MNQQAYFFLTRILFGVVAWMHLLRILNHWAVTIGPWAIPMWVSWLGLALAGSLCVWAIRLGKCI